MSRSAFVMKYFRTISIYIIYLGLQLDGTEIPLHSRVMFSIRTIKERKLRELLSFLWFFLQLFISHFQFVLWHHPSCNQRRSELVRFKRASCGKMLEICAQEVSPWKPFGIFSRNSLFDFSSDNFFFAECDACRSIISHIKRRSVEFSPGSKCFVIEAARLLAAALAATFTRRSRRLLYN